MVRDSAGAPSFIDAMNIDLKGFTEDFYREFVGGDLNMVRILSRGGRRLPRRITGSSFREK